MKIFASAGTHSQQFDRLFMALDKLLQSGKLKAEIFGQTGNSTYLPKGYAFAKFVSDSEYLQKIRWADVVIGHGGAGLIVAALEAKKPLVVLPRLKKFGEHTDDHQIELAEKMAKIGKAVCVRDISDLSAAIKNAQKLGRQKASNKQKLISDIKRYLTGLY